MLFHPFIDDTPPIQFSWVRAPPVQFGQADTQAAHPLQLEAQAMPLCPRPKSLVPFLGCLCGFKSLIQVVGDGVQPAHGLEW